MEILSDLHMVSKANFFLDTLGSCLDEKGNSSTSYLGNASCWLSLAFGPCGGFDG